MFKVYGVGGKGVVCCTLAYAAWLVNTGRVAGGVYRDCGVVVYL